MGISKLTLSLDNINGTVYEWTVSWSGLNPSYHNVCYLSMTEYDLEGSPSFNTHYFNISDQPQSSPLGLPTFTSELSPSSTSINSLTPTSTLAAPTATITQIMTDTGITRGAIAGASIGGTLGLLIVCGFVWCIYRKLLRRKNSIRGSRGQFTMDAAIEPNRNTPHASELHPNPLYEMQARETAQRYELDGGPYHHS